MHCFSIKTKEKKIAKLVVIAKKKGKNNIIY